MKLSIAVLFLLCAVNALPQSATLAAPASADQKQLDLLQAKYSSAQAAFKRAPSAKTKAGLVAATDALATATMTSEVLDARKRYPAALGMYQQALTLDPANKEAKNNAAMIDSVYHGMIAKARAKLKTNPGDKVAAAQLARFTGIYASIHRPMP